MKRSFFRLILVCYYRVISLIMQQRSIVGLLLLTLAVVIQICSLPTPIVDPDYYVPGCTDTYCFNECPRGYTLDEFGCEICECNPCRFGYPLNDVPCGQGQNQCTGRNGLCKVSTGDRAYCCPNERPGGCPTSTNSTSSSSLANCQTDFDCPVGRKCCGSPGKCVNATTF